MENTSLRDPIRSDTFIGPSAGQFRRMLGPTCQEMQDEIPGLPEEEAVGVAEEISYLVFPVGPRRRRGDLDYVRAASPRIISYRSITAATPIRLSPSSDRFSTRTTFPSARTNTSVPWVISAGRVSVISSSEPASRFSSTTK